MQKVRRQVAFAVVGFALTWAVQAQTIYRCGNSYNQVPCPDAVPMEVNDARLPEQKMQTDAAASNDARLASTMEQERLAEEQRLLAANRPVSHSADRVPTEAQSKVRPGKNSKKTKRAKSKAQKVITRGAAIPATRKQILNNK